jgi:VWFA-related protein
VKFRTSLLVKVALALAVAPCAIGIEAQQPTFRSRIDFVSVPVSVMNGREPVASLGAADFELTDNGVRQALDTVSREQLGIDVTLVLTNRSLASSVDHRRGLVSAEDVRALLLPSDRLRVVWANDDVHGRLVGDDYTVWSDPALKDQIVGTVKGNSVWQWRSDQPGTLGLGVALADALFYALAWPVTSDRRHLVVVFTDGWDTVSTLEMARLPRLATRSDAVLHAVFWAAPDDRPTSGGGIESFAAPRTVPSAWRASYRMLIATVERTGGTVQRATRAAGALAEIVSDFRSSYVLLYTPRGVAPAGWHDLNVKVTHPGSFKVRARKGYEGG